MNSISYITVKSPFCSELRSLRMLKQNTCYIVILYMENKRSINAIIFNFNITKVCLK